MSGAQPSRVSALLLVLLVSCCGLALADNDCNVQYVSTVYRNGNTVFTYNLTSNVNSINQFSIGCNCETYPDVVEDCLFEGYESSSALNNFNGYRYPYDQDSGCTQTYHLIVSGKVGTNSVQWAANNGDNYYTGGTQGPDCSADNGYLDAPAPTRQLYDCHDDFTIPSGYHTETQAGPCEYNYTIKCRYGLTSSGGLITEAYQYYDVNDKIVPVIDTQNLTNIALECNQVIPPAANLTATDNCDTEVHVYFCEERTNGTCPQNYFLTRTWTATDACGNSACFTQTITVVDTSKPVLSGLPTDLTLECDINVTNNYIPVPTVTVTDDCDCLLPIGSGDSPYVLFQEQKLSGACPNTYTLIRTWTATDCCDNEVSHTQYIYVQDTTPPVLTINGSDYVGTYECDQSIPYPVVESYDQCMEEAPPVTLNETIIPGSCKYTYILKRTWTTCDECGNTATLVRFYNVRDTTIPILCNVPADECVECGQVPPVPDVTATDNCDIPVVTFMNETIPSGNCPNEYIIKRTWTATDSCGNCATATQTITVVDTTAPVIDESSLPQNLYIECSSDVPEQCPAQTVPCLPNVCPDVVTQKLSQKQINGSCPNNYTLIRTWTVSDCSGNTNTATRYVYVDDNIPPVLYGVPADETVCCTDVPPPPQVHSSDNCDCPECTPYPDCLQVMYSNTTQSGSCTGDYTIIRRWDVVDSCGNMASAEQKITVTDTLAPTFDTPLPGDVNQSCEVAITHPKLTAYDDCGTATVNNDIPDEIVNGTCCNQYTVIQTWTACDDCGNTASYSRCINVYDNTKPVLMGVPSDTSVECDCVPSVPDVTATDNCGGEVMVAYCETRINGTCSSSYTLVRTWTATDACGNTASAEQHIDVCDTIPPQFEGPQPQDLYFECNNVEIPCAPTATDACTEVQVTDDSYRQNGTCPDSYILHRIFNAVDDCGNCATYSFNIYVNDTQPPVLCVPPDTTYECSPPANTPPATATDNCDAHPVVCQEPDVIVDKTCPNNYTIERTFTATDECGNMAQQCQTIIVRDTSAPVFEEPLPQSSSQECTVPCVPTVMATDDCTKNVTVSYTSMIYDQSCPYIYKESRTWVATDACGLSTTYEIVDSAYDNTPPVLQGVPADTTVECDCVPNPPCVTATDNCDCSPEVTYNETKIFPSPVCLDSYIIKRTWNATDACGLSCSQTQTINVEDTTPPVFNEKNPGDQYVQCMLPSIPTPTATDNCDPCVEVVCHSYTTDQTCANNFVYHVAFSATDRCGNVAWFNYTITVEDNTPPNVTWSPRQPYSDFMNFTCTAPPAPVPTAVDNCDPNPSIDRLPDQVTSQGCPYRQEIVREWIISDQCGNSLDFYDKIRLVDNTPPMLSECPADVTVECPDEPPVCNVTATDQCGMEFTPTFNETSTEGTCADERYIVRTWTAVDVCGLEASCSQKVHIVDATPPVFTNPPADTSLHNLCMPNGPVTVYATDDCDPYPVITVTNKTIHTTCPYAYTIIFTWTATDRCGNCATHSQYVNYTWNLAPQLVDETSYGGSLPKDLSGIDCSCVPPADVLTAYDGCNNQIPVDYMEVRTNGSCPNSYTLTRTWTATDACGLCVTHTQTIMVQDKIPPTLEGVPCDETVNCGFVPPRADVCATDNCNGTQLEFTEETIPGADCCDYKIIRTWTATDACGNVACAVQTITVQELTPPTLYGVPPDKTVDCPYVDVYDNVTACEAPEAIGYCFDTVDFCQDTCSPSPISNYSLSYKSGDSYCYLKFVDVSYGISNPDDTVTVYGQLYDINNPSHTYELQLTLGGICDYDSSGSQPVLGLQDYCYVGSNDPRQPAVPVDPTQWNYYTSCNGSLLDSQSGDMIQFYSTGGQAAQIGTGASGRSSSYGGYVNLQCDDDDTNIACLYFEKEEDSNCDLSFLNNPNLSVGEQITITVTIDKIPGNCSGDAVWIKTWTACNEDYECVNASQTITIIDRYPPTFSDVPCDVTITCTQPLPDDQPMVNDSCDAHPMVTQQDTTYDQTCPYTYKIRRVWTATDDCGNNATASQIISVEDSEKPVIVGVPTCDVTVECDAIPDVPKVTVSDDCDQTVQLIYTNETCPGSCPNNYVITRTWTATDCCGNTACESYEITVQDTIPPTLYGVPADCTLECNQVVPDADVTADDDCDKNVTVVGPVVKTVLGTCPGVYVEYRTWTATDSCGNCATATQTIKFVDTCPPTFDYPDNLPTNVTVECDCVPAAPTLTASDDCGGKVNVTFVENRINDAYCNNAYTLVRTWTATDCVGLMTVYVATVDVVDHVAPQICGVPDSIEVECDNVPSAPDVTATDDCGSVCITYNQTRINGDCDYNYQLVRTWTATDLCGNSVNASYTVTVKDNVAPMFEGPEPPAVTYVSCDQTYMPPVQNATDDCGTATICLTTDVQTCPTCPQNVTRVYTWTATDDCGNCATRTATVIFYDDQAPVLIGVPADTTAECCAPPNTCSVSAKDNCDSYVPVVVSPDEIVDQTCPNNYTVIRTWTATDACGNTVCASQKITVRDTQPPQFTCELPPPEVTIECSGCAPVVSNLQATDDCESTPFMVVPTISKIPGSCPEAYDLCITWTACDACGLTTTYTQTIHVVDTTPPTLRGVPNDTTVECDSIPPYPTVTADDVCDSNVSVTFNEDVDSQGTCPQEYVLKRTWTACDDCGNTVSAYQLIHVIDTTPPYFLDGPYPDITVCCDNIPALPGPPRASDNCDQNVSVCLEQYTYPGSCPEAYKIVRSWVAVDACGNVAYSNQTVTVVDTEPPVFINPPKDATYPCNNVPAACFPDFEDTCDTDLTANDKNSYYDESSTEKPNACQNYTITRTWGITDDCGNCATYTQVITVVDDMAPEFTSELPADVTVECDSVPDAPQLDADDICGSASVCYDEYKTPGKCENSYVLKRVWTATDLCGQETTYTQTVTVVDNLAPVLHNVPADTEAPCYNVPAPANVTATDDCGWANVTYTETRTNGACYNNYTLTRLWEAVDTCGNYASAQQVICVYDIAAPQFYPLPLPENEVIECNQQSCAPELNATDDCGSATVDFDTETIPGGCAGNYTVIRQWTAVDECGNKNCYEQTVVVHDTCPPVFTPQGPLCFRPTEFLSVFVLESVCDGEKGLFSVEDECSAVNITITGCTSNQDQGLYGSSYDKNPCDDCVVDVDNDKITIYARLLWNVPEGRIFTVTGIATDECGLSVKVSREIYVPLNQASLNCTNYNLDYNTDCVAPEQECDESCACEYNIDERTPKNLGHTVDLYQCQYDDVANTTEFTYTATFSGKGIPDSLVFGLDLCYGNVISYAPEDGCRLGRLDDTYVSGITYAIDQDQVVNNQYNFSFVLQGKYSPTENTVPFQFLSGSHTSSILDYASGPVYDCVELTDEEAEGYSESSYVVGGYVQVVGIASGDDRSASVPLSGVIVALLNRNDIQRYAVTTESGYYAFQGLNCPITELTVVILADGALRSNSGYNQYGTQFIVPQIPDASGQYSYGAPQFVKGGIGNNIPLLLNDQEKPGYAIPLSDGSFRGNGQTSQYWQFQYSGQGDNDYSSDRLSFLSDQVTKSLSTCTVDSSFISQNSDLYTAALNEADGKGVFEPYASIQRVIIAWSEYIRCAPAGQSSDTNGATSLLSRVCHAH